MLKLDKIKIISSINNIKNINDKEFKNIVKDGEVVERKYTMQIPSLLYLEVDYWEDELVIEFTGKILKNDYPKLINRETIAQCLSNINDMGVCLLNVEAILADGIVVKADVCKDIEYSDCKILTQQLRASINNYKKYLVRNVRDNFVIEKNVVTNGYKRRLTIYDKAKEMNKTSNKNFLYSLGDYSEVLNYFNGKIRFELNLNSKQQLRKSLNIEDTTIESVLNSTANPIWGMLDEIIVDDGTDSSCKNLTEFKNRLLLEYCGGDLVKVESLVRNYYSKGTHISQVMRPYRELVAKLPSMSPSLKTKLQTLLMEFVTFFAIIWL